ncbi:hypothetical protein [Roseivivax sp. CAU 1761]
MTGWRIFVHSARLVLDNLGAAFRVSLVLYLIQAAAQIAGFLNPPDMVELPEGGAVPGLGAGFLVQNLLLGALGILASLWIAVAWHRFVLAGEVPEGWLPHWHGASMAGYLGRSLMIAAILALLVLVLAIPLGLFAAPALFLLLTLGAAAALFFRLCPMLPAAAMGRPMGLREAWEATRGETGTMLVLALIVVGGSLLASLPSLFNPDPASAINLIYSVVVNWFLTMIGITVLTTIYGHYVEGRRID